MTTATLDSPRVTPVRQRTARVAAWTTAALYVANFVVGAFAFGATDDHTTSFGSTSEALAALGFIGSAITLVALYPGGKSGLAWIPGIAGVLASGITMLGVVVTGIEPPMELFFIEVGLAAAGLIVIAVTGAIRRVWPWWIALGVALLIPIMFFVPINALPMALVWIGVALTARVVR